MCTSNAGGMWRPKSKLHFGVMNSWRRGGVISKMFSALLMDGQGTAYRFMTVQVRSLASNTPPKLRIFPSAAYDLSGTTRVHSSNHPVAYPGRHGQVLVKVSVSKGSECLALSRTPADTVTAFAHRFYPLSHHSASSHIH